MNKNQKLINIVRHAYESCPYYKKLYQDAGINVYSEEINVQSLPIISSEDLIQNSDDLWSRTEEIYRVSSSSGTSKHPKILYKTQEDTKTSVKILSEMLKIAGLSKNDMIWIGQPFDLSHLGYLCLEASKEMGLIAIPAGIAMTDEKMISLLQKFKPNVIFTSPSRLIQIKNIIILSELNIPKFEKILLAGEPCSMNQRNEIESFWNTIPFDLYGSEETDGLACSCREHNGLHFFEDFFHLDLVQPGTDIPVKRNEPGEAVITSLYSKGTPIIRYRIGDLIQVIQKPCSCGSMKVIKVLGRTSLTFNLYDGVKLNAFQIRTAISSVIPDIDRYQAILSSINVYKDKLSILIPEESKICNVTRAQIIDSIWNSSMDLDVIKATGNLEINVLQTSSFHTTHRGKTPEIIDIR
jgi:phenylacetate-CoA ligase